MTFKNNGSSLGYILKARLVDLFEQEIIAVFVVPSLSRLCGLEAHRTESALSRARHRCSPPGKAHIAPAAQHLCYHMTPARRGITYPARLRCNYSTIRSSCAGLRFSVFHERARTRCTSVQFGICLFFLKAFWKPLANKIKIYISHSPLNTYSISSVFTFWPLFLYGRICSINPFAMPRFLGHRPTWMKNHLRHPVMSI